MAGATKDSSRFAKHYRLDAFLIFPATTGAIRSCTRLTSYGFSFEIRFLFRLRQIWQAFVRPPRPARRLTFNCHFAEHFNNPCKVVRKVLS